MSLLFPSVTILGNEVLKWLASSSGFNTLG